MKDLIPFYQPKENIIEKSNDCYVYDSEGKKFIDFEAGVWCANVGHNNERLISVMERQIKDCIHHGYNFRNRFSEQLANKLHEKIGFDGGQSVFLSSGSEAVNLAATISRHLTGKAKLLKIDNSFLSAYGYGQISKENNHKVDIQYNSIDAISTINFDEVAGFILETGGASIDVVKFPDKEFVQNLIAEARKHETLIIVDEVTTGFGRTGKWFGFMHYNIKPDIIVTAKGLGNGYPISGVSINQNIAKKLNNKPLSYLQSHINDPLGCAIALEVINIIDDENLIEKSKMAGEYFKNRLESLKEKHPDKIYDVRGRGLILALEFSKQINGSLINKELFERGLVVGFKSNVIRLMPPLTIKSSDIDELIEAIDEILNKTNNF
jgi:acetylornithine/N-succinyldiaminopimelate aminotransferase